MATLRDKLVAAIATQQGEVDRLLNVAKEDLPKAQTVLAELQGLLGQLDKNPDVEAGYAAIRGLGIKLDID